MVVELSKGGNVSLTKEAKNQGFSLSRVTAGCGWKANQKRPRFFAWLFREYDIDLSAVGLNASGKAPTQKDPIDPKYQQWFVYANHRSTHGIRFMGDNRTGSTGKSDDEQIKVDLGQLPPYIRSVVFQAVIWRGRRRWQTFGKVEQAYIRLFDQHSGRELAYYKIGSRFRNRTLVVFGELYREDDEWKFRAIGRGYRVAAFRRKYGVRARFATEYARYPN